MPPSRHFQTFTPRPGVTLAYCRTEGTAALPGVVFMGGFRSDMTGTKAMHLEAQCRARDQAYLRFDYSGHGKSSGKFEEATIGAWLQDSLDAFDALTTGPQIVVGSSLGGWLALLLAIRRAARVTGLVLLAPAPDFTEDLLRVFTPVERETLKKDGVVLRPNTYGSPHPFTQALFDDAAQYLLLKDAIPLRCPVRLIHGKKDADVPWQKSAQIAEKLESRDVKIIWVDDGDHRLSRDEDLKRMDETVRELG